jgi:HPt (histidine-containing phosphotransfer) domain-containing protein
MALHLERINWMPSPPLVPEDGPIDLAHLKRMTLGDAGLEREVLAMFVSQAARLAEALAGLPAEALQLAHTLTGSARAVGAFAVAEAAEGVHRAVRDGGEPAQALGLLKTAVAEARAAIETMLRS